MISYVNNKSNETLTMDPLRSIITKNFICLVFFFFKKKENTWDIICWLRGMNGKCFEKNRIDDATRMKMFSIALRCHQPIWVNYSAIPLNSLT